MLPPAGIYVNMMKKLRVAQGCEPRELARAAGINLESYYDLEEHEDELNYAVSIRSVARLAGELGVKPSALYGGMSTKAVSTDELASLLRERFGRRNMSLDDFEEEIGWSVSAALDKSDKFNEFNAEALRAVCDAVNVNWFDVLDQL